MAVTFTTPASGNVLVRLTAFVYMTAGNNMYWGLREGTSNVGTSMVADFGGGQHTASVAIKLTGLSAGSHTIKWSADVSGGTHYIYANGGEGQAVMEVWAAP